MMISLSVDAPLSKAIGLRLPDPLRCWRLHWRTSPHCRNAVSATGGCE
jgi:hypothetical protein